MHYKLLFIFCIFLGNFSSELQAQNIADFVSVTPAIQSTNFIFPESHKFQKILEHNDEITGGTMRDKFDFTAYVPALGSSKNGYLSINHELSPGGVTAMQCQLDTIAKLWTVSQISEIDFSSTTVNGTSNNCSGAVTPWANVISCEETSVTTDTNADGYYDLGWHVEINPATKQVIGKRWAMGNGPKENAVIHSNLKTVYFGNDANPGYLFRFVANNTSDLSSGNLFVYTGPKTGAGTWVQLANSTATERNTTMSLAAAAGATVFNGIEDVELGPDGKVYFSVKNENRVYRFSDTDPLTGLTTSSMETYVGNASYSITHNGGSTVVPWGTGNDNLAFDSQGNLWVLQDGDNNYIWVVLNGHSQASPQVKLFGIAPAGSEPTGITFTPDYKYLFLSFQHPSSTNNTDYQEDAAFHQIGFEKDIAIVMALSQNLGCSLAGQSCDDNNPATASDAYTTYCVCQGLPLADTITIQLITGNDDAEQNSSSGTLSTTSTDLEMVMDGTTQQVIGIRFKNIPILKNSLIEEASIQFTADEVTTAATSIWIHGEKAASAQPYNTGDLYNISERVKTTDSVSWGVPAWNSIGESGPNQKTPDLSSIVQEIINQNDWASGNDLSFIITGSGSRVADSFEGGSNNAPKLQIAYRLQNVNNVGIGVTDPATKLQVKDGDIFLETLGTSLILRSPDGNCWKISVSNTGIIQATQVTCP
ncbi:MAG: PhoX family protein [Saprospiraceae bacterium]|nr:PhoX family protein [Saprospiraceae bacterium]